MTNTRLTFMIDENKIASIAPDKENGWFNTRPAQWRADALLNVATVAQSAQQDAAKEAQQTEYDEETLSFVDEQLSKLGLNLNANSRSLIAKIIAARDSVTGAIKEALPGGKKERPKVSEKDDDGLSDRMSAKQVAKLVGYHVTYVYTIAGKGIFPEGIREGNRTFWKRDEVLGWMASYIAEATHPTNNHKAREFVATLRKFGITPPKVPDVIMPPGMPQASRKTTSKNRLLNPAQMVHWLGLGNRSVLSTYVKKGILPQPVNPSGSRKLWSKDDVLACLRRAVRYPPKGLHTSTIQKFRKAIGNADNETPVLDRARTFETA